MAREDRYAGGLAGGAALAAGGAGALGAGNQMRAAGRAQVRANSGSRGDKVRGGRLVRAGSDDVRSGKQGLAGLRKVPGKDGKVRYMNPTGGGFARTKGFNEQIAQGKQTAQRGGSMINESRGKRQRSLQGLKMMRKGRLVALGGALGASVGGATAVGSVAAGERYRAKRVQERDAALHPNTRFYRQGQR
jgi:hypothetical protein